MSENFPKKHSINIFNIYNSIKNSKKIIYSNVKAKPKSIPKNFKNKQLSKNRKQNMNKKKSMSKTERDNKTLESEKQPENDNNIVTNFIDSLFDEPVVTKPENNIQKKEKNSLKKINNIKIKEKNSSNNIKMLNKTDGRMASSKSKKKNKEKNLNSEIIFNDFQKKLKINKKKYICEERLKFVNQQIYLLQKEQNKLNKELSLLKLKEDSINGKFKEKIFIKKEKEKEKGKSNEKKNNKSAQNIEINNIKVDDDPESIIKFFNNNADNNGGLFPFDYKEKESNNRYGNMKISKSNLSDTKRNDRKPKKNNKLNINELGTFRLSDYNYKGNKNKFLNKIEFKTEPNKLYKSTGFSKDKKHKNLFLVDKKNKKIIFSNIDIKKYK